MHLGRFLDFSQKVVGVTLKTDDLSSHFQFMHRAKFSAFEQILHFSQKLVGVTIKIEVFSSNFQFMHRAKFSAFG